MRNQHWFRQPPITLPKMLCRLQDPYPLINTLNPSIILIDLAHGFPLARARFHESSKIGSINCSSQSDFHQL